MAIGEAPEPSNDQAPIVEPTNDATSAGAQEPEATTVNLPIEVASKLILSIEQLSKTVQNLQTLVEQKPSDQEKDLKRNKTVISDKTVPRFDPNPWREIAVMSGEEIHQELDDLHLKFRKNWPEIWANDEGRQYDWIAPYYGNIGDPQYTPRPDRDSFLRLQQIIMYETKANLVVRLGPVELSKKTGLYEPKGDKYTIPPMFSLIGYRLRHCKDLTEYWIYNREGARHRLIPERFVLHNNLRLLLEIAKGLKHWVTVGSVLDKCYERDILEQPDADDFKGHEVQLRILCNCMLKLNIHLDPVRHSHYPKYAQTVDGLRALPLAMLCEGVKPPNDRFANFEKSGAQLFRPMELSVVSLEAIGELKIEWTEYLDDHLLYEQTSIGPRLKLFWFGMYISPMDKKGFEDPLRCLSCSGEFWKIRNELRMTLQIMFPRARWRDGVTGYDHLPLPNFLRSAQQYKGISTLGELRYAEDLDNRPDCKWHLQDAKAADLPTLQSFDQYPYYGERLRILKAYMDSKKPGGIRGLWRDKRDTLQWHTFWAVVLVGGMSLLLSLCSLVVAIMQTVVAFKALKAENREL